MAFQINVLVDNYADMILQSWSVLQGINEGAYQKKLQIRTFFSAADLVKTLARESRRYAIVISESKNQAEKQLSTLNGQGIHPIFINQQFSDTSWSFSSVMPNVYASFYTLTKTILEDCAGPSAFVAFNKDSIPDKFGLEAFKRAASETGVRERVFSYSGDIEKCIGSAVQEAPGFKNIFCTNDLVAVLLMKKMKDAGLNLADYNITGCSNMKIGECFKPSLTTIGENYKNAGIIAVETFVLLFKRKLVQNLYVNMESDIIFRESTALKIKADGNLPVSGDAEEPSGEMVDFYGDKPINDIRIIESMLSNCDDRDFGILRDFLASKTYEEIAENQGMAANTVKYRLKKIESRLKVTGRSGIYNCLKPYDFSL